MNTTFSPVTTSDQVPAPPREWRWCLLRDVARLESGHTPSRREPSYWNGGSVPWLSLKDIRGLAGRYVTETADMPTRAGIDNSSARILPRGTVAFCRTASVGKAAILGCDMATSQDFANWVCGPDLLPDYLYEALRASGAQFDKEKQGTTHKTIYMPVLERFRVLVPPLSEQRRIADILDKADAIRRKRSEAIVLSEELLYSTFLEIFGDPVTNPREWPEKLLGEVAEVSGGLQVTSARSENPLPLPYLRVANVYRDRLDLREIKEIRVTSGERDRALLRSGDVLVVEGHGNADELGRAAVWNGEIPVCTHQNHLIRVRGNVQCVMPSFLSSFLNSSSGRAQMLKLGKTTSGLNTISTNNIRSIRVLVPPLDLQERFAEISRRVRNLTTRMKQQRYDGDLLESLVACAFSGMLALTEISC